MEFFYAIKLLIIRFRESENTI